MGFLEPRARARVEVAKLREVGFNVPALRAAAKADEDGVNEARWAAGDAIREKSAITLTGLAVKLAYALYSDTQQRWHDDIHADGFAGNYHQGLVAAYLDAVRMAGLPEDLWRCGWVDYGPIA